MNKGRTPASSSETDADDTLSMPTPEKKRNKHPLLPPIVPQPGSPAQPAQDAEAR